MSYWLNKLDWLDAGKGCGLNSEIGFNLLKGVRHGGSTLKATLKSAKSLKSMYTGYEMEVMDANGA